ncbi:hypothetical protein LCGC14_1677510 [marine sediment metagenome]|uniref:Uncharacterized protein n=1 Tax=marine sediment metagenome TaxID=412755 RepID=A0A0F9HQ32_9ZZZZ
MKARPDLEPDSSMVLSSPNDYYIDPDGKVNEIEDDEERILFGTVANPSIQMQEEPESAEDKFWKQATEDTRVTSDPQLNPHLKALDAIIDVLEKK